MPAIATAAIQANPLMGILLHGIGGLSAAVFFVPHHKARRWSWETYWLVQSAFCWLLLPLLGAWWTIPNLAQVLAEAPTSAMRNSFLLGVAYGIGGTAFGMAIRYIGYSLTYAFAIGLSTVLGTLLPPLVDGKLGQTLTKPGGMMVLGGIAVGLVGISLCGYAGWLKEQDLPAGSETRANFNLVKGIPLCILSGFLSAVFNFALLAGQPVADVARAHGAGMWEGNVVYIFAMSGALVSTTAMCLRMGMVNKTLGEYGSMIKEAWHHLPVNYVLAGLGGLLWYLQFFFYGLGHVRMGNYKFTSWAIHMVLLIFFSNLLGLALREWKGCRSRTVVAINLALAILVAAVLVIGYGNYLGEA